MELIGIGIDIVEIDRIEKSIERHGDHFLDRIFTEGERTYCDAMKMPARYYAARFAAKEAVSKAFGTGIGESIGWKDIEVLRLEEGKPVIALHGPGKAFAATKGELDIQVSLTHSDNYAAANSVIIRK